MELPCSKNLPIQYLIRSFEETTTSYKYLWFWSLINQISIKNNLVLYIDEIIAEMLILSSRLVIENKLSLGRQDKIKDFIALLNQQYLKSSNVKYTDIQKCILENLKDQTIQNVIQNISRYVPFRFLTPWFYNELNRRKDSEKNELIAELSNQYFTCVTKRPLYKIDNSSNYLEVNHLWAEYIIDNYKILEGFILWHFEKYLNKNNPNVPNIQEKLKNDNKRNLIAGRRFWNIYLNYHPLKCIYSGSEIFYDNFSLDHYLPWSYCNHDYLWNLIPTKKEINSSKSDCVPSSEFYLDKFICAQLNAFRFFSENNKYAKLLEDYVIFFNNNVKNILEYDEEKFTTEYKNRLVPQIQIAKNMGFRTDFIYQKF